MAPRKNQRVPSLKSRRLKAVLELGKRHMATVENQSAAELEDFHDSPAGARWLAEAHQLALDLLAAVTEFGIERQQKHEQPNPPTENDPRG